MRRVFELPEGDEPRLQAASDSLCGEERPGGPEACAAKYARRAGHFLGVRKRTRRFWGRRVPTATQRITSYNAIQPAHRPRSSTPHRPCQFTPPNTSSFPVAAGRERGSLSEGRRIKEQTRRTWGIRRVPPPHRLTSCSADQPVHPQSSSAHHRPASSRQQTLQACRSSRSIHPRPTHSCPWCRLCPRTCCRS